MPAVSPWRLRDPEGIRLFDDTAGAMLFNPHSWQTHRVAPMVSWIVQCLRSGPWSRQDFLDELGKGDEDLERLAQMLDNSLAELHRLQLIVPTH